MARFKTFTNGGNILPSDINATEDDYECSFGTYKHLASWSATIGAGVTANTYTLDGASGVTVGGSFYSPVWLDPARYWSVASTSAVNPRSVFYNVSFGLMTNTTAPGITFTASLRAVTGLGTLSAAVAGSTVTIATPPVSSAVAAVNSGDFAAPVAGYYVVAVVFSGTTAGGSSESLFARLTMRQV